MPSVYNGFNPFIPHKFCAKIYEILLDINPETQYNGIIVPYLPVELKHGGKTLVLTDLERINNSNLPSVAQEVPRALLIKP